MSAYFLKHHVQVCQLDDGLVFLDLKCQRYLGIGARHMQPLLALLGITSAHDVGNPTNAPAATAQVLERLLAQGLLTTDPAAGRPAALFSISATDDIPFHGHVARTPHVRFGIVWRFIGAYVRAVLAMRLMSLNRIVNIARRRKAAHARQAPRVNDQQLHEVIRVFRRVRPLFYTAKGACLFDSLTLVEFLASYRVYPDWAFGVRTRPFGAHTWVQHQGTVLNDTVEATRYYTPILLI